MRRFSFLAFAVSAAACAAACGSGDDSSTGTKPLGRPDDFVDDLRTNISCALSCDPACTESDKPWTCPALAPWDQIPHDTGACGGFDGKTFPPPQQGACSATDPTGEALTKASDTVLPDGRRLAPAGVEWLFDEQDLMGGFPANAMLVPGTKWLVVNDVGYLAHSLRAVDTTLLKAGGSTSPVVSHVKRDKPGAFNYGLAWRDQSKTMYVASGTPDDKIFAYTLDTTTGALAAAAGKDVKLPADAMPQGIAISPDGKTLLVGLAKGADTLFIYSLDDATYGQQTGSVDLGTHDVFTIHFDPNDASGNTAYATLWKSPVAIADASKMRLVQIDVAGKTAKTISVGKAPEELAFLDARYAVVANASSDSLSIVDRPAGNVAADVKIGDMNGAGPTGIAFDATKKRLYVALSNVNGVAAYDVDMAPTPPTLTLAGTIPTAWWPTSINVDPGDGTVYVTTGRGHGTGADATHGVLEDSTASERMHGSVQAIPYMDSTALADATSKWTAANAVSAQPGYSTVQCNGAPYDFPVPDKVGAPSDKIKHVFFVVRENKSFDAIFGDVPGLDGEPGNVSAPGRMDQIWPNTRAIGGAFAHMDNYYSDAEQSIQGHMWTVYGRSNDYCERRWTVIWGRGEFSETDSPGVADDSAPAEGSLLQSMKAQGVGVDNDGELLGGGLGIRDTMWPGGSTSGTRPDTNGACYLAGRLRALCNPNDFTYTWLVNDHTFGLAAGKPNPAVMIATNDEATGMLLDGLSHSPSWQDSLFIVVEDDPNGGGDHVDLHRSIALFASPWIKRHYVSHAHYDVASIHKLIAHIYGKPYRNSTIANAPLPLDLFSSTPDYTPYEYKPRAFTDLACNPGGTTGAEVASHWDFTDPDEQPGLGDQVVDALRALPPPK